MNCTECIEFLVDYREGLLEESQKQEVTEHLKDCQSCRIEASELKALQGRLVKNGKDLSDSQIEDKVLNRIIREQNLIMLTKGAKTSKIGKFSTIMGNQPRVAKVLAALLVSMTAGAMILMALGDTPQSNGPIVLSKVHNIDLGTIKEVVHSRTYQSPERWGRIEIYYSGTKAGNIEQLASLSGLASTEDINCHFVICNGLGASDGQIQSTKKWQRQWSIIKDRTWNGSGQTIRICIIADGKSAHPTDSQEQMTQELVKELRRRFDVKDESVYYPSDWK